MIWKVRFYISRLMCLFKGCEESRQSSWNMPDDWHSPTYCKRCGACDDVYGIESSPFPILYNSDGFFMRLKMFFGIEK